MIVPPQLALALAVVVLAAPTPANEPVTLGSDFRVIAMFGGSPGDSRETLERSAAAGVTDVEVNFVATRDGVLVTGHDSDIGGDCGDVSLRTAADLRGCRNAHGEHPTTLSEVLAMPFARVWVDLKSDAVPAAAEVIGSRPGAILMVYEPSLADVGTTPVVLKGYPDTPAEIHAFVDTAAASHVELVCLEARWLSGDLIEYARARGIGVLPWIGQDTHPELLRVLIRSGVVGLIALQGTDLSAVYRD